MKITLLGSGGPLGMPVPLCGCEYCEEGSERLRAGLMVETEKYKVGVRCRAGYTATTD